MLSSPNEGAASEPVIRVQTGNTSAEPISPTHRKAWPIWSGACFAIVLLAVFGQHLLSLINYVAGSALYLNILLVPFCSAYLLYIRRDQFPKKYVIDLPLAILSLTVGLGIMAFAYSSTGLARADNGHLVLLTLSFLCCLVAGGFFFFGRGWMRAAAFPLAYLIFMVPMPDAMADAFETPSKDAAGEVRDRRLHR